MWTFLEDILHDRQCRKGIRPTGVAGQLRDSLRGLRLCQTAVHRAVEVVRNLRDLALSNKCADRDETSIARCKVRTQPQVAKQNISGVLHDARSDSSELLFYSRGTFRLSVFVEWKRHRRSWRKVIGPNLTIGEDYFRDGDCRHRILPAGVKSEMRDDLRNFAWLH